MSSATHEKRRAGEPRPHFVFAVVQRDEKKVARRGAVVSQREIEDPDEAGMDAGGVLHFESGGHVAGPNEIVAPSESFAGGRPVVVFHATFSAGIGGSMLVLACFHGIPDSGFLPFSVLSPPPLFMEAISSSGGDRATISL